MWCTAPATRRLPTAPGHRYARQHGLVRPPVARRLSWLPFVESTELALLVGEPHATVHRALSELLTGGVVGKATHGTVHLPSSGRYHVEHVSGCGRYVHRSPSVSTRLSHLALDNSI